MLAIKDPNIIIDIGVFIGKIKPKNIPGIKLYELIIYFFNFFSFKNTLA